jgi:outer membrane protein insertion porin family
VRASGTARYTDEEILAASGLELGQSAAEGDFQEAAKRLVNSGLFTEVRYSFSYSDAGAKVEFQLADIDGSKLVPVRFDNLVWFTDSELRTALAKQIPLFKGETPMDGQSMGRVARALQALLDERHVPGRVDYLHEGKPETNDMRAIVFRVEDLEIRIHNIEFPGTSAEQAAWLAGGARKLAGAKYSRSMIETAAQDDLLPILLQHGYLEARFGAADAHVVKPSGEQPEEKASEDKPKDEVEVDAIVPVMPGKQYLVSEVSWKGNSAISMLEAAPFLHLTEGRPADAMRLLRDVEALTKLYRSRGYMTVQVKPDAQLEHEKGTVHYVINIAEGDLYKMGELDIVGVDTASKERLRAAWALREGQPYNADYTKKFIDDAPRLLPKGLEYSTKLNEELDAKGKTVDVTIQFKAQ